MIIIVAIFLNMLFIHRRSSLILLLDLRSLLTFLSFSFCPSRAAMGKGGGKKGYADRARDDYSKWERPWSGATIHTRHDPRFKRV